MRKEIFIHFAFFVSTFIFISLVRDLLNLSSWQFWVGGLIGTILPDIDHFIYVYLLRPHELTSQRFQFMLSKKEILSSVNLLSETRYERTKLIFHTIYFQVIFLILSVFVITSSGSLLGRGIVTAFSLHLLIDQIVDYTEIGNIDNWFREIKVLLGKDQQKIYIVVVLILILLFSFFL